jgi:hypothetical protein
MCCPNSGNTVVKHLTIDPEFKGFNPDTTQHYWSLGQPFKSNCCSLQGENSI